MDEVYNKARLYHDVGMAIIWLHPKSKRPVDSGWTSGDRLSWEELERRYQPGMNVGVRLGSPSKIGEYSLACLDIDVRDERALAEVDACLKMAFSELGTKEILHEVESGSGGASRHLYFLCDKPFRQVTFGERKTLDKKTVWAVVGYSEGRQMVLPPSIHPDTGRRYRWKSDENLRKLKVLDTPQARALTKKKMEKAEVLNNWEEVPGARMLVCELPPRMRELIQDARCEDRSAALVPATRALISAGASEKEILSILTDPEFKLSETAYEHVRSYDRRRAVEWLWKYTVERLWLETRAPEAFKKVAKDVPAKIDLRDLLHRNERQKVLADLHNLTLIVENAAGEDCFARNEFSNKIHHGKKSLWGEPGGAVTDEDVNFLMVWFSQKWELHVTTGLAWSVVVEIGRRNKFHPVRSYLQGLEWDGKERIDSWLRDFFQAEMPEPYLSQVSRKFLLAAVARIMRPGAKFDHILVLEGDEGIGKSTAPQILASPEWFTGSLPNIRDKDALQTLQGCWFIELSELRVLANIESESYKAFFSTSVDRFRVPYGRATEDFPRQCVFVGTTNHSDYLVDNTGNRRFWPVRVGRLSFKKFKRERDQLWAEAFAIWSMFEEPLYLEGEALRQARTIQSSRVSESLQTHLVDTLGEWLEEQETVSVEDRVDLNGITLRELFGVGWPWRHYKPDNHTLQLAARAMVHHKFERYYVKGRSKWRPSHLSTPSIYPVSTQCSPNKKV